MLPKMRIKQLPQLQVQFTLGAATVLSERLPYIASFHVVVGAALLGVCSLFILRCHPVQWTDWSR